MQRQKPRFENIVVQNRLFACMEVGNNLSSYNVVFSMNMSYFPQ